MTKVKKKGDFAESKELELLRNLKIIAHINEGFPQTVSSNYGISENVQRILNLMLKGCQNPENMHHSGKHCIHRFFRSLGGTG